ncbi:type ISP restriction/modification enzyme [Reyranella soli]|uniref:type ISP restriction/modification enzyme n=1 Tax=Reyranella soli TaxID=1230389 RepID=UPI0011BD6746|nr:type ISP restriction/modification enzyme [Reyranella soli]
MNYGRLEGHSRIEDDGILAFVSNSSFLHKNSFDGFRAVQEADFNELWVLDLKGDARTSGEDRRRQGGNIFGDQIKVGIAIYCFVKKKGSKGFKIFYDAVRDYAKADEKMEFIQAPLSTRTMQELRPDARHNWLNLPSAEFEQFIPIATKETKATKIEGQERAIFKLFSLGISTNRDEWLYDRDQKVLTKKVRQLIGAYDAIPPTTKTYPDTLKWSRNLKRRLARNEREPFSAKRIVQASYRPYSPRWLYQSDVFTDELGLADELFPPTGKNVGISFSAPGFRTNYCALAVEGVADLHFGAAVDGYQQVTRYRFEGGKRLDNVTDWALSQFRTHYGDNGITKDNIFAYVYAVLHDPKYHQTFTSNLKREFPRVPFHRDFKRWCTWGKSLLDLHLGYLSAKPYALKRTDVSDAKARSAAQKPRVILRADERAGTIVLDTETQLSGIPGEAWEYKLGNRSALEWVLDQHKERQTKDVSLRRLKLAPYSFSDHKEGVIDLLKRVTTVSLNTVEIVDAMKKEPRA